MRNFIDREFNFVIIPIGNAKWYYLLPRLFLTARINDNKYRCLRLIDSLYSKSINKDDSLPTFVPSEPICLEDGSTFKVIVSYPIKDDKLNRKVLTPWFYEEFIYNEAKWIAAEKIIKEYSEYIVIYIKKDDTNASKDIERVIDICNKNNKSYRICSDDKEYTYDDMYNYFVK